MRRLRNSGRQDTMAGRRPLGREASAVAGRRPPGREAGAVAGRRPRQGTTPVADGHRLLSITQGWDKQEMKGSETRKVPKEGL
ncbi:hypothetical protein GUJ93_ZPchr0006g41939 [Zizania palustris]|uniref:Uncharacterized protein n=1 Tax=Zizania palustris TaxID=103762 RepID=A0A8J5VXI4_ZIZPA|nr:hypothetical protein GUJ93_ZPchr0006g41939 [Zizania palustris]